MPVYSYNCWSRVLREQSGVRLQSVAGIADESIIIVFISRLLVVSVDAVTELLCLLYRYFINDVISSS